MPEAPVRSQSILERRHDREERRECDAAENEKGDLGAFRAFHPEKHPADE